MDSPRQRVTAVCGVMRRGRAVLAGATSDQGPRWSRSQGPRSAYGRLAGPPSSAGLFARLGAGLRAVPGGGFPLSGEDPRQTDRRLDQTRWPEAKALWLSLIPISEPTRTH